MKWNCSLFEAEKIRLKHMYYFQLLHTNTEFIPVSLAQTFETYFFSHFFFAYRRYLLEASNKINKIFLINLSR